jgi:hypothetical protein
MVVGQTFANTLNFLLTEFRVKVSQVMLSQYEAEIIGHVCVFTASKSLFISFPKQICFLLMLSKINSFYVSDDDNEILLMRDCSHGVEETCVLITQGNPSDNIPLFPISSFRFQKIS